ncbi:conserved virulence factor C family protein [Paenibacillus thalictri]|uniref:Virulence factor n=1 Tax=Paenibacillus thalictri TaxID=2527873 RepID=A0A4Q9DG83_9BACL|nr:conserved virulence factor C family protein [Paenibacillus thalictri]TBL71210.1 virulence factor [Paenibacillus thalictri]
MRIHSIEPTPSPNTMKINVDEKIPDGVRVTYTADTSAKAPAYIRKLLGISGVASVYRAADFIAVDRTAKADWQAILAGVREALGGDNAAGGPAAAGDAGTEADAAGFGEVTVLLQTFRGIPLQVRVSLGTEQQRAALPERFSQAAVQAGTAAPNLIKERQLEELGVRYGELRDVLDAVVQEIDAAYDPPRLEELVRLAMAAPTQEAVAAPPERRELSAAEVAERFASADWKQRYAALRQMRPAADKLPLLERALGDANASVRRLAAVYLGDLKSPEAVTLLCRALEDDAAAVRRTVGDTLSDIGDPAAIPAMVRALSDPSKIVRWRAARFLFEVGDDTALPALRAAENDPEFEISMQIKMAVERIEGGHEAEGSVWQQMTRRDRSK